MAHAKAEIETGPIVPLWDVNGLDVAFGGGVKWPARNDARLSAVPRKFASSLFYNGGKLADHDLQVRADVDKAKFMGCLRAMLGSWDPPHEVKMACAGSLIQHYCETIPTSKSARAK